IVDSPSQIVTFLTDRGAPWSQSLPHPVAALTGLAVSAVARALVVRGGAPGVLRHAVAFLVQRAEVETAEGVAGIAAFFEQRQRAGSGPPRRRGRGASPCRSAA